MNHWAYVHSRRFLERTEKNNSSEQVYRSPNLGHLERGHEDRLHYFSKISAATRLQFYALRQSYVWFRDILRRWVLRSNIIRR